MKAWCAALLMIGVSISGCSATNEYDEDAGQEYEDTADGEQRGGETYLDFDERRDKLEGSQDEVGGYGCTEDCSGHDAGYQWAADRGVDDPGDCGGNSWSFEEGCRSYAEEQGE